MYVLQYFNILELTIDTFQRYTYICNCTRKLPTDTLPCILHYVKPTYVFKTVYTLSCFGKVYALLFYQSSWNFDKQ